MTSGVNPRRNLFEDRPAQIEVHRRRKEKESENDMIPVYFRRRIVRGQFGLIQRVLFGLIVLTFVFTVYSSVSLRPLLRVLDPHSYVVVLDAGSTGTRIHVYQFRSSFDSDNVETFVLTNELFEERKPGLSSFADQVDQAQLQIDGLLEIADRKVSRFKHRSTPIVLRATAGLRLLDEDKQKNLLDAVANSFSKYGFYRPAKDIAIMNETEEGIDAWLTLVYLKGEQFYASRIAALDLGGGSTQITFNPSMSNTELAKKLNSLLKARQPVAPGEVNAFRDKNKAERRAMARIDAERAGLKEIEPDRVVKVNGASSVADAQREKTTDEDEILSFMHQFTMFAREISLYSKSYLGYGLMIARQTIFINETSDRRLVGRHQLESQCLPEKARGKFKFQEVNWSVSSKEGVNNEQRFYSCLSTVDGYISDQVRPVAGLDQMSIYVFSYFYDIGVDAGLVSAELSSSSTVTPVFIRDLKQTGKLVCSSSTGSTSHPFLCFDLVYIYSLLTKGYGLSEETQINICKKIHEFEVAWSLGLALKLL